MDEVADVDEPTPENPDRRRLPLVVAVVAAVIPLVVAVIALAWRPWAPVLDMAMTEFRVRDVGGRHTPLIGLPGRIGNFPDQGSHPGPASFYLLAPFYRLGGSTAWGLELGSVAINSIVAALIIWLGRRRAGVVGVVMMAATVALAIRGYGLNVLTHPWNPYFPVLLWLLVLVAAWAVLAGDHWMALIVVIGGSVAAQTHVPYLLNAIAINVLVVVVLVWRWWRGGRTRDVGVPLLAATVAGALMWLPPLIDQLIRDPGNIRMLIRHFASEPPEPAIGVGTAVRVFFRHLDAVSVAFDVFRHDDAFVYRSGLPGGSGVLGAVVFVIWLACCAAALRWRHRLLNSLNVVIAVGLATGAFSILRIFGKVWYYLTLWAWGTLLLVVVSIAWTGWVALSRSSDTAALHRRRTIPVAIGVAVVVIMTSLSIVAAASNQVPEHQLSDGLRAVVPATTDALDAGMGPAVGRDGRYLVFWQDAVFIGAQGYGLVNELERRGYDVGVHDTWRVPVTPQRVFRPGTFDAEVHLVSGKYVEMWRDRPEMVEVIEYDVRTPAERAEFDRLHAQVVERLTEIGRTDLIDEIDINLFGTSLDPELPDDVVESLGEMLLLAEPIAVFLAPPGSSF